MRLRGSPCRPTDCASDAESVDSVEVLDDIQQCNA